MNFNPCRRRFIVPQIAAVTLAVVVSGGQTANAQQTAVEAELPPGQAPPAYVVGYQSTWRNKDGSEVTFEITGVEGRTISVQASWGCSYKARADGFAPTLEWKDCGGSTGSHTVKRTGNIYPLQVGNTESWKYRGKNKNGDKWSGTRKCTVKGTVNVTVPAGNFDTYHVVCKEKGARYEWHYSPELRKIVTTSRIPKGGSSGGWYRELVSFTQ